MDRDMDEAQVMRFPLHLWDSDADELESLFGTHRSRLLPWSIPQIPLPQILESTRAL